MCVEGVELSQDAEALRELVSLSSSQLEEMENSASNSCKDEEEEDELFHTSSEHAQLVRKRSDDLVFTSLASDENSVGGSSRKRSHPGF